MIRAAKTATQTTAFELAGRVPASGDDALASILPASNTSRPEHLRVRRILHLEPRRRDAVRLVATAPPLGDASFGVTPADRIEQSFPTADDVILIQQRGRDARHDPPQRPLAFQQRPSANVLTLNARRSKAQKYGQSRLNIRS